MRIEELQIHDQDPGWALVTGRGGTDGKPTSLIFPQGITVLFGANSAGKTTVLEAIDAVLTSIIRPPRLRLFEGDVQRCDGPGEALGDGQGPVAALMTGVAGRKWAYEAGNRRDGPGPWVQPWSSGNERDEVQVRNESPSSRVNAAASSLAHGQAASRRKMRRRPVETSRPAVCQAQ